MPTGGGALPSGRGVLVFTATYNEAGNIAEWYARVRAALPEASVLIVDDGSPDGTGNLISGLALADPRVVLIERAGKLGLGSAHKLAFQYALDGGYDALITMDADLSHEPEQAPSLLDGLADCDFVIGTRWGDGTCDYRGVRRFVSWGGNWVARLLLRTSVSEYTTSFRAFNRRALECILGDLPADDGYAFFMEVVVTLHRRGLRLGEVPINFRDRVQGTSKIPRGQILVSSARLFRLAIIQR